MVDFEFRVSISDEPISFPHKKLTLALLLVPALSSPTLERYAQKRGAVRLH